MVQYISFFLFFIFCLFVDETQISHTLHAFNGFSNVWLIFEIISIQSNRAIWIRVCGGVHRILNRQQDTVSYKNMDVRWKHTDAHRTVTNETIFICVLFVMFHPFFPAKYSLVSLILFPCCSSCSPSSSSCSSFNAIWSCGPFKLYYQIAHRRKYFSHYHHIHISRTTIQMQHGYHLNCIYSICTVYCAHSTEFIHYTYFCCFSKSNIKILKCVYMYKWAHTFYARAIWRERKNAHGKKHSIYRAYNITFSLSSCSCSSSCSSVESLALICTHLKWNVNIFSVLSWSF